ncbi:hypothetical protein SADUNF_Sadunf10G0093000 [Salix dunnii]|uniref:Uncharacterized protein n=1 Tax=Salix dunnii TaxID=1413687 RepID=A0A835MRQ8_9ROSI|nr:hypothetical protein SADUNF_Sadunf10G0093000 [Salix dunnii]
MKTCRALTLHANATDHVTTVHQTFGGGQTSHSASDSISKRVAVKYFEKSEGKKWRSLLEREDFKELNGADLDTEKKEGNSFYENSGLDLNLDPNPNE